MSRKKPVPVIHKSPDVMLSPALATAKPSPKSLAAHHYQRKLAAHFAPHILPRTFQALKDGVEAGNTQVIKMVLELYELAQSDKKISIINDNRQVNVDARGNAEGGSERRSFEATARLLEQAREKRITEGNPLASRIIEAEFTETPEGMSK